MASLLDGITICIPGHDGQEVQLKFSHASWGTAITYNYDGMTDTLKRPGGWDPNSGIRWEQTVTLPFAGKTTVTWTDVEGGDTPHSGEIKVLEVACPAPETTTTSTVPETTTTVAATTTTVAPPPTEPSTTTTAPPPPTDASTTSTAAATTTTAVRRTTTTEPATTAPPVTEAPTTAAPTTAPAPSSSIDLVTDSTVAETTTTTIARSTTTTVGVPTNWRSPDTGSETGDFVLGGGLFLLFGALCIGASRLNLRRG